MKGFGLELRKINGKSTKDLYDNIDEVLSKNNIPSRGVSMEVETEAIAHSLQKMFKSTGNFSVCTVRECAEIGDIVIPHERMNIYRSIHCMDWSEMVESFRQQIVAMVLDDFRPILSPQEEEDIHTITIS